MLEHTDPHIMIISSHLVVDVVQTPDAKSFYQAVFSGTFSYPSGLRLGYQKIDFNELILSIKCMAQASGFVSFTTMLVLQAKTLGPWLDTIKSNPLLWS